MPSFQALSVEMSKIRRATLWILNILRLSLTRIFLDPKPPELPINANDIGRILIVGYSAIGDAIFLLPMLSSLRKGFPKAHIVFMANDYPTAKELIPSAEITDEIWIEEIPHTRKESQRLNARIRSGNFNAVIVVPSAPVRFLDSLLSIPIRIGHCRKIFPIPNLKNFVFHLRRRFLGQDFERFLSLNFRIWIDESSPEHAILRGLKILSPLGISGSSEMTVRLESFAHNFPQGKKYPSGRIGIHIGSEKSQYNKIWPAKNWAILSRMLYQKYGVNICLLGGPDEKPESLIFADAADFPYEDLIAKRTLAETFSEIYRCDLFLASDTGLSKAAMAMKIPTVTLYGPTSPRELGIFWQPEKHLEIKLHLPCMPCVMGGIRKEGFGTLNYMNCGDHPCMGRLSPDEIFSTISAHYDRQLEAKKC